MFCTSVNAHLGSSRTKSELNRSSFNGPYPSLFMVSVEMDSAHLKSFRNGIYRLHLPMLWLQNWNILKKLLGQRQKSTFFYARLHCVVNVKIKFYLPQIISISANFLDKLKIIELRFYWKAHTSCSRLLWSFDYNHTTRDIWKSIDLLNERLGYT